MLENSGPLSAPIGKANMTGIHQMSFLSDLILKLFRNDVKEHGAGHLRRMCQFFAVLVKEFEPTVDVTWEIGQFATTSVFPKYLQASIFNDFALASKVLVESPPHG